MLHNLKFVIFEITALRAVQGLGIPICSSPELPLLLMGDNAGARPINAACPRSGPAGPPRALFPKVLLPRFCMNGGFSRLLHGKFNVRQHVDVSACVTAGVCVQWACTEGIASGGCSRLPPPPLDLGARLPSNAP